MPDTSIFHEDWWLNATSANKYCEVEHRRGDELVARLPFVVIDRLGFRTLRMPDFTHLLGPVVAPGTGKFQTRLMRRHSVVQELVDKLPKFDYFKQAIDPTKDDGLAWIDGLAFQSRGFQVSPQYTFEIDCEAPLDDILNGMSFKARQHVRRAIEAYRVSPVADPQLFVKCYLANVRERGLKNRFMLDNFPALFTECYARRCGMILGAFLPSEEPIAMTFLVWTGGTMYFLLSTRAPNVEDKGSISLLIWSGIKKAQELGLKAFDLDGVSSTGTARFYSAFGGKIKTRLLVTKIRPGFNAVRGLRSIFAQKPSSLEYT